MLRKQIKIVSLMKLVKYAIILSICTGLNAQFKDAAITFDDRLLRDDEKSSLFNLKNSMTKFYVDTVWNDEYRDLELNLNCLLYTSPSPRDRTRSRMPSSA